MAGAVAAVAFHRYRGGPAQELQLDLRQAVHTINPGAFWHPTLNGEPAPHPLLLDNPFTSSPTVPGWALGDGIGGLPAPGRPVVPVFGCAARCRQGRHGGGGLGRPRARRSGERPGLPICAVRTRDEWRPTSKERSWLVNR